MFLCIVHHTATPVVCSERHQVSHVCVALDALFVLMLFVSCCQPCLTFQHIRLAALYGV